MKNTISEIFNMGICNGCGGNWLGKYFGVKFCNKCREEKHTCSNCAGITMDRYWVREQAMCIGCVNDLQNEEDQFNYRD